MQFIGCVSILLLFVAVAECRGKRNPSAMNDVSYNTIVKLIEGSFNVPCAQRTVAEKSAITRYHRYRGRFTLQGDPPKLFLDGERVLKKTEIPDVVMEEYIKAEGSGIRRIHNRLKNKFSGISEEAVRNVLSQCSTHRRLNERFPQKVPYIHITATRVMDKIQVDLLELRTAATYKQRCYRYILTAIDEFSRYTWLRPIETKSSSSVARELSNIFDMFGAPAYIQHNRGREFQGKVKVMLNRRGIQDIPSAPYHPRGKVVRPHRTLGSEILFHLITEKCDVNWVRKLPDYATVLNDEPMEILGWNTPFNVFFGRYPDDPCSEKTCGTSIIQEWRMKVILIIEQTSNRSKRANKRLNLRQQRSLKMPTFYSVGDKVLVRLASKKSRVMNTLTILPGRITKRKLKKRKYKIAFTHPCTNATSEEWFRLGDITADTLSYQNKRERVTVPRRQHVKNYYIPVTQKNRIEQLCEDSGLSVRFNPTGDGNCQFRAVSDQLATMGILRSHVTLRQEVVQYLETNACFRNGRGWSAFLTELPEDYLTRMLSSGSYGDHLTLQAIADILNIQILVISSLNGGTTLISPEINDGNIFSFDLPYIVLGHLSEGNGEHYLSLTSNPEQVIRIIRNSAQIVFEGDFQSHNVVSETSNDEGTDEGVNDESSDRVTKERTDEGVNDGGTDQGVNDDRSHVLVNEEGVYDKEKEINISIYDRLPNEILTMNLAFAVGHDVQSIIVPAMCD